MSNTIPSVNKASYEQHILDLAANIIRERFISPDAQAVDSAENAKKYMSCKLARTDKEVFGVLFLNTQLKVIEYRDMFKGTIDSSAVHIREVLKAALELNASCVIVGHNHPSGDSRPSQADIAVTRRLKDALELMGTQLTDHIVVGRTAYSFRENHVIW